MGQVEGIFDYILDWVRRGDSKYEYPVKLLTEISNLPEQDYDKLVRLMDLKAQLPDIERSRDKLEYLRSLIDSNPPASVISREYLKRGPTGSSRVVSDMYEAIPDPLKQFHNNLIVKGGKNVIVDQGLDPDRIGGVYLPMTANIALNDKYVRGLEKGTDPWGMLLATISNTAKATGRGEIAKLLAHELAHAGDYAAPAELRGNISDEYYRDPSQATSYYGTNSPQEMFAEAMLKSTGLSKAGTGDRPSGMGGSDKIEPWEGWRDLSNPYMDKVITPWWKWAGMRGAPSNADVGEYRAPDEQITTVDQSPSPTIQDIVEQILSGPRITTIPQLPMGPRITDAGSFLPPTTQITTRPRDLPQPGIDQPMTIQDILDTISAEEESNRQAANEFR